MKMKMHWLRVELLKILNLFLHSFQLKFCSLKTRTLTILVSPDAYEQMSILPFSRFDFYRILVDFFRFLFFYYVASDLHPNGTNDDDDGVQNCIFTVTIHRSVFI
ncbi:hypothetical protein Hanom_Chr13g01200221 [Helianthus anomalus]